MILDVTGAAAASTLSQALSALPDAGAHPSAPATLTPTPTLPHSDAHVLAFARMPALLRVLREAAAGALGEAGGADEVRARVARPAVAAVLPAMHGGEGSSAAVALLALLVREHSLAAYLPGSIGPQGSTGCPLADS